MERRLLEAARKGNIHELDDLISTNEQILEEMALEGAGHTPLHVACVGGHLDFVRELLKHMPKLAEKVNPGGFSPLHIVAARGDVEIAEELLNVGTHLCSLKGRERRIPLHYAVENGEVNVMKVLLSKSPESVEETTALEETALHLAVKNNRFDAVVVLVDHLKQHKKEQVINWKDHKGNTALHLAAAAKNFEVVDFLLRGHAVELEVVDVNARNESGLMPLDVLTLSQRGERDREIREILTRAGSVPTSIPVRGDDDDGVEVVNSPQSLPRSQSVTSFQLVERFDFPEFMLVIATLIATLTYQAVLQPPISVQVDNNSTKGTHVAYIVFMSVNTFALLMSARIIIFCTSVTPFMLSLVPPVVAVVLTYILLLVFLPFKSIDKQSLPITVGLLGVLPLIISVLLLLIRKCLAHFFDRYVAQQRNANLQQHQMDVSRRGQILM